MKRSCLLAALSAFTLFAGLVSTAGAITVTSGDIVTVNFDLSGDPGVITPPDRIDYLMLFDTEDSSEMLNPGESLTVYWYENPGETSELKTDYWSPTNNMAGISESYTVEGLSDAAGTLVIRDISGSIDLLSIEMRTISEGVVTNFVAQSYQVSSVPIPSALWLFGSGLLGLIGISRKRAD